MELAARLIAFCFVCLLLGQPFAALAHSIEEDERSSEDSMEALHGHGTHTGFFELQSGLTGPPYESESHEQQQQQQQQERQHTLDPHVQQAATLEHALNGSPLDYTETNEPLLDSQSDILDNVTSPSVSELQAFDLDEPDYEDEPDVHVDNLDKPLRGMSIPTVERLLNYFEALLFRNATSRDLHRAIDGLQDLAKLLEAWMPPAAKERQRHSPFISRQAARMQERAGEPTHWATSAMENRASGLDVAASAMFHLAALRASGLLPDHLPRSTMQALEELHLAARGGSLEAMFALADRFLQGYGVSQSCEVGLSYARIAAQHLALEVDKEQRYALALAPVSLRDRFMDGAYIAAHDAENGEHIVHMEEDMALRGNVDAQRRMAYRRLVGRGMEADPEGAFHDFQAAAAAGDPYAIFNVGYMYLRGLYVAQNFSAAREQFEVAADKGLPAAYNGLGVLAWNGQGMAQNLSVALEAFERGAALNNSDCLYNLGTMHHGAVGVPRNETLGVELFERADKFGHWRAPYMLAMAYDSGSSLPPNCTLAGRYYRKFFAERSNWGDEMVAATKALDAGDRWGALVHYAYLAEQGSAAASANAAWLLKRGVGQSVPNSQRLARSYYERAAHQGHAPSMVELAHMTVDAEELQLGRPSNATEALRWYQQAADQDSPEGLFYLGWAHQYGIGMEENATRAVELYRRALTQAGIRSPSATAPLLALASVRVDSWLQPLAGAHAMSQVAHAARHLHDQLMTQLSRLGLFGQAAANDDRKGVKGQVAGGLLAMGSALQWLEAHHVDVENLAMTCLLGALAVVLYVRRRRMVAGQVN